MIRFLLSTLCVLTLGTATLHAHTVWIEPKDNQLVIRFAEPGEDFETSPGHLDSLSAPVAFQVVTNKPAIVEAPKKSDHFLLTGTSPASVVCVESTFTMRGGRLPIFYARWQPAGTNAAKAALTLDLVPTGKAGEVRAYFRGKPLGNVAATLRTPDGKEQELKTDADGFLHFTSTQSGLHLLTLPHYREPLAGFHAGSAYDQTSHNAALTWRQP